MLFTGANSGDPHVRPALEKLVGGKSDQDEN